MPRSPALPDLPDLPEIADDGDDAATEGGPPRRIFPPRRTKRPRRDMRVAMAASDYARLDRLRDAMDAPGAMVIRQALRAYYEATFGTVEAPVRRERAA